MSGNEESPCVKINQVSKWCQRLPSGGQEEENTTKWLFISNGLS